MNKPDIRFNGFNGEWEEKNLGKICTFSKGHGYSKNDLTSEGTPVYLYGQMYTNYKTILLQSDKFVRPQSGSVYSTGKEVILPASGETPEDIARATAVLAKGIILGGDINIVYPPKELKQEFLALSISYENNKSKLAEQAQGATISHLHGSDIAKLSIAYPSSAEQNKIGNLFSQIDSLISSTQKELDKLVSLKKCMLQKMFPKKGSLVPEIRFEGFSGDWVEKKLGEIFRSISNAFVGTASPYYVENGHFYLESNNVKNGQINRNSEIFINDEFYYNQRHKWLHENDIVMVQSGHVGHSAVIPKELDNTAAHALIIFTDKYKTTDSYFINYSFMTSISVRQIEGITKGNTIKHILSSDMKNFIIAIPNDYEEQQKIGSYFQNLDNLISKQSAELEKLKNVKKTLLSKMFV